MSLNATHFASCPQCAEGCARAKHIAWVGGLLSVFPVAYLGAPLIRPDSLPICPFRCATGQPCPFCGLTRAFAAATHLHWHEAFHLNPIWPLAAAVILVIALLHLCDAATGRSLAEASARAARTRWMWIVGGLIAFDVWRIVFFNG